MKNLGRKNKAYKKLQEWWESGDENFEEIEKIFNLMYQAGREDQKIIDESIIICESCKAIKAAYKIGKEN